METIADQVGVPQHGEGSHLAAAEAIRDLRKALGLTQRQLAQKLFVRPNTIWRYEVGIIRPSRQVLLLLSIFARSAGRQRTFMEALAKSGIQLRGKSSA
jgi:transcriptional regulator with XRE-family HTH domain